MQEIEAELINSKFAGTDMFGECPLYFSALQNLQMILRFLFSQSQFDHLRYDSLTLALSQKTTRKSTRSYSFIAHSLATQGLLVLSIGSAYIHVKMARSYVSCNMIKTRFRHTLPPYGLLSKHM